jgi:hypothetical protein
MYTVKALTGLISHAEKADIASLKPLVPMIVAAIRRCAATDDSLVADALDVFEELAESP